MAIGRNNKRNKKELPSSFNRPKQLTAPSLCLLAGVFRSFVDHLCQQIIFILNNYVFVRMFRIDNSKRIIVDYVNKSSAILSEWRNPCAPRAYETTMNEEGRRKNMKSKKKKQKHQFAICITSVNIF